MSGFTERLLADLREFSGHLLDAGAAPRRRERARRITCSAENVLLGAVESFVGLLPHLLDEIEDADDPRRTVERRTWNPTRARLSTSPGDWQSVRGRLLPLRWIRIEPLSQPEPGALEWLLHLEHELSGELDHVVGRTLRFIDEARAARRGTSGWAVLDEASLSEMTRSLKSAGTTLVRARREIVRRAGAPIHASRHAPSPFPRGRSWWRLRQLARTIEDRESTLVERIADLLGVEPHSADQPVLYQRWCGMRLVQTLESAGWRVEGDVVGALYLAGHVRFRKADACLDLWIENRITREPHSSGFICVRGEDATPDFLIVAPGAGGVDAFVLDATCSTDEEVLADKGKYLDVLQGVAPAMVAGVVSGPRRPLRSWSCAPFDLGHCRLATQSGSAGVVPMHPLEWNPLPLRAWLSDVDRHARAWG